MSVRFVEKRKITSVDELSAVERAQLQAAGKSYDGEDLPVEARLEGDGSDEIEGSFAGFCDHWKVVDGAQHLYDAWFFMVDSGAMFRAGTTDEVAAIIQFGLECEDPQLRIAIGAALVEAKLLPRGDSAYAEFAAALAAQS